MKKTAFFIILAMSLNSYAQLSEKVKAKLDLYPERTLDSPGYQKHIGEVCFSNESFELDLAESKYIKTYTLGDNLSMRAWFANSPSNSMMIQLAESGKKPKEIKENKYSFKQHAIFRIFVYFDGILVDQSSDAEDWNKDRMSELPALRADFNDGTSKNWYGERFYKEILSRQDLLTPGIHKLKVEVFPYKRGYASNFPFKAIAVGELDVIVPEDIKVSEENCFPKKKMDDKNLEAELLKAFKSHFTVDGHTAIKVIITDNQFTIFRDRYNDIVKKSIMAAVVYKTEDQVSYKYFIFDKNFDGVKYARAIISSELTLNGLSINSPEKKVNSACLKFLN